MLAWEALSDLDVETLVRDLFAAEWHTHVESFRRGPDQGIDLRVVGPCGPPLNLQPGTELIAQVKHYPNATASRLRSTFRKESSRKFHRPHVRYVAVTTAKLSLKTKDEIAALFSPPLCASDVYGREDLEAMLARNSAVEQRHIRLWLAETSTLKALLHGRERRLREHVLEDLVKAVPLLTPTRHLAAAARLLDAEGAVIISGPPGAGKTSTAMLLIAAMIRDGWDLVVAEDRLDDAEHLRDETVNQVVYYDDFLGSSLHTLFLAGKNEPARRPRHAPGRHGRMGRGRPGHRVPARIRHRQRAPAPARRQAARLRRPGPPPRLPRIPHAHPVLLPHPPPRAGRPQGSGRHRGVR